MSLKKLTYCILVSLLFVSCKNGQPNDDVFQDSSYDNVVLGEDLIQIGMPNKLDYLIDNLSLSDEMIGMLASFDKSLYDDALLNPTENVKFCNTSKNKAVNMGVYGAELNYLIHFGQTQYSMKYMLASKQLADQIGVAMAFDQQIVEEYQSNVENKDSLINIIFAVYDNAKRMLKNEEQFLLSSLVIVGSWVENMYITTTFFNRTESVAIKSKLVTNIVEQKNYLTKMIECVSLLDEGDNVYVTEVRKELEKIDSVYGGFGDRLLLESDVATLNKQIAAARNVMIKIN